MSRKRFFCDFLVQKLSAILFLLFVSGAAVSAEIKVYAAASLTDVLTELAAQYQRQNRDDKIQASFAGSSTLAKQIENGAPADIFISADLDWADYLQKRNLLNADSRKNLLSNQLVLIAPVKSELAIEIKSGVDLTSQFKGKLCTGEPAYVPVGKYAKQSLTYLNWWNSLQPRLVGTEDVRTALAFVERAECALGIVYKTDANLSKKVKTLLVFPAESHAPIVYPLALTHDAQPEAKDFWQFLQSDAAAKVFLSYGFDLAK